MAIDLLQEELIDVGSVPGLPCFKGLEKKPNVRTIWRWVLDGSRGVYLETVLISNRRFTTETAVHRFIHATTAVADGRCQLVPVDQNLQAARHAEQRLREAGI